LVENAGILGAASIVLQRENWRFLYWKN
jgi:hypothetical protein